MNTIQKTLLAGGKKIRNAWAKKQGFTVKKDDVIYMVGLRSRPIGGVCSTGPSYSFGGRLYVIFNADGNRV